LNTGCNLVGFVGALLVPMTADALGWPWAMASGALLALVGAALWLGIRADRPMPVSSRPVRS
jgi:membrane protein implicated in regulation of membrane protease activity